MKRRDFLKKSVVAAGLVGTLKALEPVEVDGSPAAPVAPQTASPAVATPTENRSAEYLKQAQGEPFFCPNRRQSRKCRRR